MLLLPRLSLPPQQSALPAARRPRVTDWAVMKRLRQPLTPSPPRHTHSGERWPLKSRHFGMA